MDLSQIRKEIDDIDSQLLPLFLRRMRCAEQVAQVKKKQGLPVFNAQREEEILDRVGNQAGDYAAVARQLYSTMMSVSRDRQHQLLGSGKALRQMIAGACEALPVSGVKVACPVENSSAGSVTDVYDLILQYRFFIVRAATLPVRHCLCGTENTGEVRLVFSHPQGLAQCSDYLASHGYQAQEYSNTAAAAKMLSMERLHHAAVICSHQAAKKYGLTILEENIQNARDNRTRFIVISRSPCLPEDADKISLCFSLPNVPGSLHEVLGRFAMNGLNLTKIESRPIRGKAFEYDFYLDFTGNVRDAHTLALMGSLSEELPRFTFLGNYLETTEEV